MKRTFPHQRVAEYTVAGASVAIAFLLELLLGVSVVGVAPLFFAAVMVSTWFGGLGPGMAAAALSGLVTTLFFMEPMNSLRVGIDDLIRVVVFLAVSVLISSLQESTQRSQEDYRRAMEAARQADSAKSRFLAVLSHELRNPLSPVLHAAGLHAEDPQLPASIREDFQMIRRNIELEARLIDDLLDLSRITQGKLVMDPQWLDVGSVLDDSIQICRPELRAKSLRLDVHATATRRFLRGDATRLRQVFWNLLRNAIKFTAAGGTITVELSDGPDEREVVLRVSDTGIGIAPETLPSIFAAFEQGEATITRNYGGLGLGLAISQALIVAHGGRIEASSKGLGCGSSFTVTLPTTAARPAEPPRTDSKSSGDAYDDTDMPRHLRILLVEDHLDTANLMARILRQRLRHEVLTAGSVAEALDAVGSADARQFDLVVSDIGLPDGSGLDLMRQLRSKYGLTGIALTGYGMDSDRHETEQAGFMEHLTKPVRMDLLEAAIDRVARSALLQ